MNPFPVILAMLRRNPVTCAIFTLLIALALALGVAISAQERALRQGSARAADGFDLLVAAPGSQTDLLLSTVFLRPSAVELLPPEITTQIMADPAAEFAAPIAFGDSHGDSPVIGTTAAFVQHLGKGLGEGQMFEALDQAVIGALVPADIGAELAIRHGHADDLTGGLDADSYDLEQADHSDHDPADHDHPAAHGDVRVTGRMLPTGTPWDHAIIVPVEFVWLAHGLGTGHAPDQPTRIGPPWQADLTPGIPAIVIKPKTIADAYGLRARYRTAQSTAFFPAETLVELYSVMGQAVQIMSALTLAAQMLVVAAILAGIVAVLDVQRRSFAVLRAMGAPAGFVLLTVWLYIAALLLAGTLLALPLGWAISALLGDVLAQMSGVALHVRLGWAELRMAFVLLISGAAMAGVPAWRSYRQSVVKGLG